MWGSKDGKDGGVFPASEEFLVLFLATRRLARCTCNLRHGNGLGECLDAQSAEFYFHPLDEIVVHFWHPCSAAMARRE